MGLGGILLTGACSPPPGAVGPAAASEPRPSYYPADYDRIVQASKQERELTIYSNMDSYNWQPIIEGFQAHYPWVSKINTTNLGSSEVFQRANAEASRGNARASLLVSGAPQNWMDASNDGALIDYQSPELPHLPPFGRPLRGVYSFSSDVMVMAYNSILVEENERPDTLEALADLVEREPERFMHKLATYTSDRSFGLAIQLTYSRRQEQKGRDPWALYDRLLPCTRAEESSGPILDKIASGEYLIGFFLSSTIVFPQQAQLGKVVGWSYIRDASPLFLRGMGVPHGAPHQNAATLLLDYVLSHEGQVNVGRGGFTPFRDDVTNDEAAVTYRSVTERVGEDNVVLIGYDLGTKDEQDAFNEEWVGRLG
jgi:iron(III) transport system substrate-binding protein